MGGEVIGFVNQRIYVRELPLHPRQEKEVVWKSTTKSAAKKRKEVNA